MDSSVFDIRVYANSIIDALILIKDSNRDKLSVTEIDALNDACNLISHNIDRLEKV